MNFFDEPLQNLKRYKVEYSVISNKEILVKLLYGKVIVDLSLSRYKYKLIGDTTSINFKKDVRRLKEILLKKEKFRLVKPLRIMYPELEF